MYVYLSVYLYVHIFIYTSYVHGSTASPEKLIYHGHNVQPPPINKYFTVLYCNRPPPRWNFPMGAPGAGGAGVGAGAEAGAGAGGAEAGAGRAGTGGSGSAWQDS